MSETGFRPTSEVLDQIDSHLLRFPLTFGTEEVAFMAACDTLVLASSIVNRTAIYPDFGKTQLLQPNRRPAGLADIDWARREHGEYCERHSSSVCSYKSCYLSPDVRRDGPDDEDQIVSGVPYPELGHLFFRLAPINRGQTLPHHLLQCLGSKAEAELWNCLSAWENRSAAVAKPSKVAPQEPPHPSSTSTVAERVRQILQSVVTDACRSRKLKVQPEPAKGCPEFERVWILTKSPSRRFLGKEEKEPLFHYRLRSCLTDNQEAFLDWSLKQFKKNPEPDRSIIELSEGRGRRLGARAIIEAEQGDFFRASYDTAAQSGFLTVRVPQADPPHGDLRHACFRELTNEDRYRRDLLLYAFSLAYGGKQSYREVICPIHVNGAVFCVLCAQFSDVMTALHFYGDVIPVLATKIRSIVLGQYCYEVLQICDSRESVADKNAKLASLAWVYPFDTYELAESSEGRIVTKHDNLYWDRHLGREDAETREGLGRLVNAARAGTSAPSYAVGRQVPPQIREWLAVVAKRIGFVAKGPRDLRNQEFVRWKGKTRFNLLKSDSNNRKEFLLSISDVILKVFRAISDDLPLGIGFPKLFYPQEQVAAESWRKQKPKGFTTVSDLDLGRSLRSAWLKEDWYQRLTGCQDEEQLEQFVQAVEVELNSVLEQCGKTGFSDPGYYDPDDYEN